MKPPGHSLEAAPRPTRRPSWRAKLVLLSLGVGAGLLGCELLLRLFGVSYSSGRLQGHPVLHHVHPANFFYVHYDVFSAIPNYEVRFDAQGLIVNPRGDAGVRARPGAPRVAFMGDSFLEGIYVPFTNTFFGRLEQAAQGRAELKNFGVLSYSPVLYALQWREVVSRFRPTLVFLLLYSNDVRDDEEYLRTARVSADGEVLAVSFAVHPAINVLRGSYLVRFLRKVTNQLRWAWVNRYQKQKVVVGGLVEENPDLAEGTRKALSSLVRQVRASGAQLYLMAVPSKARLLGRGPEGPEFSDKVKAWAAENGVDFIDLTGSFQAAAREGRTLFYPQDIHFNAEGHAVVARELQRRFPALFGEAGEAAKR